MKALFVLALVAIAIATNAIPDFYDTRVEYPNCITPILDQGNCGSCWAFSTVESISERYCIASGGRVSPLLSPQYLANCDKANAGCNGGDFIKAYAEIEKNGNDDLNCTEYTSGKTGRTGTCPTKCDSGSDITKDKLYFLSKSYSFNTGSVQQNVLAMQTEIMTYGPISAAFIVYQDFIDFFKKNATGIYMPTRHGGALGGHAIKIIGWGEENGIPYWQCVNSWSTTWGDKGYFKIIRGVDESNIETRRLAAGIPLLNRTRDQVNLPNYAVEASQVQDEVINGGYMKQPAVTAQFAQIAYRAVERLGAMNAEPLAVQKVLDVYTQVVNGVNYKFRVLVSNGENGPAYTTEIVVHQSFNDDLNILAFY
jgi:cathepsin B